MFTKRDFDDALISPEKYFNAPMDVLQAEGIDAKQKMNLLKHWELNARDLQVATEENMGGPGRPRLAEVRKAIIALCENEGMSEADCA